MDAKKRIGLLTLVIALAGVVFAAVDAVVSVTYAVVPSEPSGDFFDLVINGPLWWKINPLVFGTLISVGIVAFLLGGDFKFSGNFAKSFFGFLRMVLTFLTVSFSGLGDIISQTFIECFTGNFPFSWLGYDWWWTRFMPIPAILAVLMGHGVPSGIDMALGSIVGLVFISVMWLHYYGKLHLQRIRYGLASIQGSN